MVERYHEDYTIGWICALPVEMAAAIAMLDEEHPTLPSDRSDSNTYVLGRIGLHNIVIACLPYGIYGTVSAASVAAMMRLSYPSIQVGLMVGLGGGVPNMQFDIRLGDVIVGAPTRDSGGVIQYDYGKTVAGGQFEHTGSLNKPPYMALTAISRLQAQHRLYGAKISAINSEASSKLQLESNDFTYPGEDQDQVFDSSYDHPDSEATCSSCDRTKLVTRPPRTSTVPHIHYGLIASGNQVMKHGATRDRLARQYGFLCFEMEAAGLVDHFPCVVIRGICDYADSHKSKQWQAYAAMVAAAYTKELLIVMPSTSISIIELGSGKTIIATSVVDVVRYGAGEHPIPSAFFYCEPDRREILEASYIVTSFINQLYPLLKSDAVAHSDALRLIRASFGADSARPEFDELASILLSVDSSMPGSIYMLDGLDLLSEKDIRALLKMFHTLLNVRQSSSRVLLFSRRYLPGNLQIPGAIPGVRHISTDLNVLGDIEEYIRESIREKTMYKKITDNAKLLADMKKRLLQKSSGMFLWVYLQLEIIWDTCITDAEIRQKLDDLPKDLEETYNHCLRRIDPSDSRIVNVLKWVSFASRPLLLGELSEATVLRVEDHKWDPGRIPNSNFVVSCCANLVVEDPVDTSVRFAHPSVRDHLLRNWNTFDSWPITAQQGELDCGEICISYLSFSDFCLQLEGQRGLATAKLPDPKLLAREATMTSAIGKLLSWRVGHKQLDPINIPSTIRAKSIPSHAQYRFLSYAIENWAAQMKQINPTSPVWEKFCRLALTCNETWNFHPWMSGGRSLGSQIHALFGWAVKQGHIPLLKIAMEAGPEILQICNMPLIGEGLPALHVAAKLEDTPTLSLLLTICAVNNRDKDGRTALHHAASTGNVETVRLLLNSRDVEWNIRSDDHLTPIYIAARGDYLDIVSCLLDKGASAVADPSPLVVASIHGNMPMLQELLERGAGDPSFDEAIRVSLWSALNMDNVTVVQELLKWWPLERRDRNGKTLLALAVERGSVDVAWMLIRKGADKYAEDSSGRTPLALAIQIGCWKMIWLLLDAGTVLGEKNCPGETPLLWAVRNGLSQNAAMLLRGQSGLETVYEYGRTLLFYAIQSGDIFTVRLLIERNANLEARDLFGRTPLAFVSYMGNHSSRAVAALLLDHGADLHVKDRTQQTPLMLAARSGLLGLVKLYLERGAILSEKDDDGRTPLAWALRHRQTAVIEYLRDWVSSSARKCASRAVSQ